MTTLEQAIDHYKYGISHDIFAEPVTTYAKLSIKALEKQIPKKPTVVDESMLCVVYCNTCGTFLGYPYRVYDKFCKNCGQALDWSDLNGRT